MAIGINFGDDYTTNSSMVEFMAAEVESLRRERVEAEKSFHVASVALMSIIPIGQKVVVDVREIYDASTPYMKKRLITECDWVVVERTKEGLEANPFDNTDGRYASGDRL